MTGHVGTPGLIEPESIATALKLRRSGATWRGACPACGRSTSFALATGRNGQAVAFCHAGCGFDALVAALEGRGLAQPREHRRLRGAAAPPPPAPPAPPPRRWSAEAARLWESAAPLEGSLAERYLAHRLGDGWRIMRDAVIDAGALRFLPRGGGGEMLALVVDAITGEPLTIHRTRLGADARKVADGMPAKLLLRGHQKRGGVVRLVERHGAELGLAEGIETALAVIACGFSPCWSTLDAGNLATMPVLPGVDLVTVFADFDAAGLRAATACVERWRAAGRGAAVVTPSEPGTDWNDAITGAA